MKLDLSRLWGRPLPPSIFPNFSDPEYALAWNGIGHGDLLPPLPPKLPPKAMVVEVRVPDQEWLVKYRGSFWRARPHRSDLPLAVGDEVRVVSRKRNVLLVEGG